jgi:hypothetical protein
LNELCATPGTCAARTCEIDGCQHRKQASSLRCVMLTVWCVGMQERGDVPSGGDRVTRHACLQPRMASSGAEMMHEAEIWYRSNLIGCCRSRAGPSSGLVHEPITVQYSKDAVKSRGWLLSAAIACDHVSGHPPTVPPTTFMHHHMHDELNHCHAHHTSITFEMCPQTHVRVCAIAAWGGLGTVKCEYCGNMHTPGTLLWRPWRP